jgi:Flp pilus assembly protein TadB
MPPAATTRYLHMMHNSEMDDRTYAWNWFALHAGQRLQLVNFWLVAVAFLASAFVQALLSHMVAIAFGISVAGIIASLAFMRLDARTRELVQVAENALRYIEENGRKDSPNQTIELVKAAHEARRWHLDSYRIIIQGLQLSLACLFFLGGIYSLVSG